MRDAFAVLFFVAMGMLFDPGELSANLPLILATLAVILLGKPLSALLVVLVLGYPVKVGFSVAFALAQVGEFSFILAALGRTLGVLPPPATQALVAAAIVSITINPLLFRLGEPLARWFTKRRAVRIEPGERPHGDGAHRSIVIGYGPVGRTLAGLLREHDIEPTIVELNHETANRLRADGVSVVHGDASRAAILESTGIGDATSLFFSASGSSESVIRAARELNPNLLIVARATYVAEVDALRKSGADDVVSAEGEVALAMAEHLLLHLGATADQLDRTRDRVRASLKRAEGAVR